MKEASISSPMLGELKGNGATQNCLCCELDSIWEELGLYRIKFFLCLLGNKKDLAPLPYLKDVKIDMCAELGGSGSSVFVWSKRCRQNLIRPNSK